MDIFKVAGVAVITALLAVTVRTIRPEMGLQVALAGGLLLLLEAVSYFTEIGRSLYGLAEKAGIEGGLIPFAAKTAGIAYMTEAAGAVCRDAGESSLAVKAELCGRLMLISFTLPMLIRLAELLSKLIGESA